MYSRNETHILMSVGMGERENFEMVKVGRVNVVFAKG